MTAPPTTGSSSSVRFRVIVPPRGDNFFDGLCVGTLLGMAATLCLFAVMAVAGVYGG